MKTILFIMAVIVIVFGVMQYLISIEEEKTPVEILTENNKIGRATLEALKAEVRTLEIQAKDITTDLCKRYDTICAKDTAGWDEEEQRYSTIYFQEVSMAEQNVFVEPLEHEEDMWSMPGMFTGFFKFCINSKDNCYIFAGPLGLPVWVGK